MFHDVTNDIIRYGEEKEFKTKGDEGERWVDLGLSVLWAAYNVGASSPEEYGGYYAWGETENKTIYNWNTYKWCMGDYTNITKYGESSTYGIIDYKRVLELDDDAAHVNWGGNWRMPTAEEMERKAFCSIF